MQNSLELAGQIFSDELDFEKTALEIFRLQAENNSVYKNYLTQLKTNVSKINSIEQIPFLPIQFFKSQKVITAFPLPTAKRQLPTVFSSSGTTDSITSTHYVTHISLYEKSFTTGFHKFYGNVSDYCILALLPSYLERENSSLVYMAQKLIAQSKNPLSGFYLSEFQKLETTIATLISQKQKFILLGVTFALLDFAEYKSPSTNGGFRGLGVVMETGGMKGRRKEMVREEVHDVLKKSFGVEAIHSEYGMTELLSQAYSSGNGIFKTPPWMRVLIRNTNDPFQIIGHNQTGGINVIDFANIYSCSFIATQDLGKLYPDNSFEVMGRFDFSDLRGCNLMIE